MNFSLKTLSLGLWLAASLSGCIFDNNNCDSCGRCTGSSGFSSASSEARVAQIPTPSVLVWTEPSGEVVLDVAMVQSVTCTDTRTENLFFRWDPNTSRLESRIAGPSAQARQINPTTTGGGVRSYEDVTMGLTIQVTDIFSEQRVQITALFGGRSQQLTCVGGFNTTLACR